MSPSLRKFLAPVWCSKNKQNQSHPGTQKTWIFYFVPPLNSGMVLSKSPLLAFSFLIIKWSSVTRRCHNSMINPHPGEGLVKVSMGFIASTPTLKELIDHHWGLKQWPLLIHLLIPDENKEFPCKQGASFPRLREPHDSGFRGWTICPNIDPLLWGQSEVSSVLF